MCLPNYFFRGSYILFHLINKIYSIYNKQIIKGYNIWAHQVHNKITTCLLGKGRKKEDNYL
jgi:hypothetical protein